MDAQTLPTANATLSLLFAQSRILKALAGGTVLRGTAGELIQRLDVSPEAFRPALRDLTDGGWIFVSSAPDGQLIIGRERRVRDVGPASSQDRRGAASLWERPSPFTHS